MPIADPQTLAQLAVSEPASSLRHELAAELLKRGDPSAVRSFLELIGNRVAREDALEALVESKKPPVEILFAFLESSLQRERLTAAVALGRLDGPVITRRLIQLARYDAMRQEALVALLASEGEGATRFLDLARQDAALLAAVDAARFQLQYVTQ
jgi:hypothetical protein